MFFFNDTATTEIYTLSLHDALPICSVWVGMDLPGLGLRQLGQGVWKSFGRSEEHTSELQSHLNLVCRLLLEKKQKRKRTVDAGGVRTQVRYWRTLELRKYNAVALSL